MASKRFALATLAMVLLFSSLACAQDTGPYKVLKIQLVGGDGGFDYVTADPDGRNLYVMPWSYYKGMTAEDKTALIAALKEVPPVANVVPPSAVKP